MGIHGELYVIFWNGQIIPVFFIPRGAEFAQKNLRNESQKKKTKP